MNKKQIAALAMCIATAATAVVGGTLAFFTDKDDVNNVFTIGNLDINLYEKVGVEDSNGETIQEIVEKEETGFTYSDLVPTYKLTKEPVVENLGSYDAYVRVAVVMNNASAINDAIDGVYEEKGLDADEIQAKYDEIFDGWGINYSKRAEYPSGTRMWMDDRTDDKHVLFNIDTIARLADSYYRIDSKNHFMTDEEKATENGDGIYDVNWDDLSVSYYVNAAKTDERVYVFYLKLDGKAEDGTIDSYKLFDGLNVPADFTAEQMAMFDDLHIDVYADAIQVAGFATAEAAFNALEAEHPLGYWND